MARTGRPKIEIDKAQFEDLCNFQCTLIEIAHWFKCSEDTIERWCKREYGVTFADTYKKYSAGGRISLRRAQFRTAEAGNATMQIWLGKQVLGQRDFMEVEVSKKTAETIIELDRFFDDEGGN